MQHRFLILFFVCCWNISLSQHWQQLEGGVGNWGVYNMYSDSNYLYISGNFAYVDGQHIKGIARWDGTNWDSLGAGIDGLDTVNYWPSSQVTEMIQYKNELCICGGFSSLGNINAKGFGRWNGLHWDTLVSQPPACLSLAVIGGDLFLGGGFDSIAGIPANSIAKWNDTIWQSLGFPNFYLFPFTQTASITSICYYDGKIYVAGDFESYPIGTDTVGNILCYDGTNWTSLAGGVKGFNAGIWDMKVYKDELYVGGYFFEADGNPGEFIQRWNGNSWNDVGGGTGYSNGSVYKLVIWQDKLFAMGVLQEAGGVPASKIAVWDGDKWCALGSVFDNDIMSGTVFHDSLFVGGGFKTIDGDTFNYVAKWNGGSYVDSCSNIGFNEYDLRNSQYYCYPNPVSTILTVSFSHSQPDGIISLSNVFGQVIINKQISLGTFREELNVSVLASGIYFVTVRGRYFSEFVKVIKE